jgi:hypothetical protein
MSEGPPSVGGGFSWSAKGRILTRIECDFHSPSGVAAPSESALRIYDFLFEFQ